MNVSIRGLLFLFVLSTLFVACSKRKMVITAPEVKKTQINTWTERENPKEDIDVSDIDNGTVQTETPTTMQESTPSRVKRIAFPVDEYKKLPKKGSGIIKGKIYLKTAQGDLLLGHSTRLYLNPVTSYSQQWYDESYIQGHKMKKADDTLFNYLRFTASNEQGEFAFYGVPAGKYYLIGTVKCADECGYDVSKNIRIASKIEISDHKMIQKDLMRVLP